MHHNLFKIIFKIIAIAAVVFLSSCSMFEPSGDGKEYRYRETPYPRHSVEPQSVREPVQSGTIAWAVQKVSPSVVGISTTHVRKGSYEFGTESLVEGIGSGFIVSSEGHVLTNDHVAVSTEAEIVVILHNGDEVKGRVLWTDPTLDLAMIKIKAADLPAAELGDSSQLIVGDPVIAIGTPLGLQFQHTTTAGIISALDRTVEVGTERGLNFMEDLIQTDASINPGNSGGPLVNLAGQIIGINTVKVVSAEGIGSIGLGFAIASNLVKQVSEALIKNGEVIRPFIGVAMQELTEEIGGQFGADYGVIVSEVIPGEAAEKAGIKNGDVIQKIGGKKVHSPHELLLAVTSYQPGDKIEVAVKRDGKEMKFTLIAGRREGAAIARAEEGTYGRQGGIFYQLGLRLKVVDEQVVVQEIRPDGAVAKAADSDAGEILPGDIIHEVNRIPVKSITEFVEALDKTRNNMVIFYIERFSSRQGNSFRFFLPVQIDNKKE